MPGERDWIDNAVTIVNTWITIAEPSELIATDERIAHLLRYIGRDDLSGAVVPGDAARVRKVRRELRGAFEARDEDEAVARLNALLRRVRALPRLVANGEWALEYGDRRRVPAYLGAMSAVALLELIGAGGWSRFGLCSAAPCDCVFVDRSRNATRKYCTVLCADRANQAALRRRRRAAQVGS